MSRTDCPSEETLSEFALGKLAPTELESIAHHLDDCARCEELASHTDGAVDAMVSELQRLRVVGLGTELAEPDAAQCEQSLPPATTIDSWGEFRIVRELGRGGMGVVFEAYQGALNRHVAIKFLPIDGDLARFRREARAAGRLHHTNIVPVFGVGGHQGRHFYVMQYIVGRGLDTLIARRGKTDTKIERGDAEPRFDDREAARIGVQVAEALAYAHGQGVIHRDIKPSNLLLDEQGTVWVTDFGLAHDASDTVSLTQTGDFLGTLRYVAPERLSGQGDERSDLYGLGATLYELVCGRAAYHEPDRSVLLHKVLYHEPPRPRQCVPSISRDFETILLRAMAREPSRRYATARALAEDLHRFLDDRSILARRAGPLERAVRWSRRNKLAAGLVASLVLVFLAGFTGVTVEWRRANAEAIRANLKAAAEAQARTSETEARTAEKKLRIRAQTEIATRDFDHGTALAQKGDVDHGLLWMAQALYQIPEEQPEFAQMVRANLSGWENLVLRRRAVLDHVRRGSEVVQFSPDGRAIITLCEDRTARLWDLTTGRMLCPPMPHGAWVRCAAFSPDGVLVATGCNDKMIRLWNAATGEPVGQPLMSSRGTGPQTPAISVEFSPDGRLLLSHHTRQATALWDVRTGQKRELPEKAGIALPAWFLPGGNRVLLLNRSAQMAGIWDTETGEITPPTIRGTSLRFGGFSQDNRVVGTSGDGRTTLVWDLTTGKVIATLPTAKSQLDGAILSPDGRLLFACYSDTTALIWDVVNDRPAPGLLAETGFRPGGAFSPDGRLLVTIGPKPSARIFDVATGRQVGSSLRHERPVERTSFSPDGRQILTICKDGDAVLWEVPTILLPRRPDALEPTSVGNLPRPGTGLGFSAFNSDGSRVVHNGPGTARLVEASTGQPLGRPILNRWPLVKPAEFSSDGKRLAITNHDIGFAAGGSTSTDCRIFDAVNGRPLSPLLPHANWVSAMDFSPDGSTLATGDYSGSIHLWDAATGAIISTPFSVGSIIWRVAFSPDRQLLAVGTAEPTHEVMLLDLATGKRRGDPVGLRLRVSHLEFSPDGSTLLAAARIGPIPLIDTTTGQVRATLRPDGRLFGIEFSPDGRLILTSSENEGKSIARLWDVRSGEPVSPIVRNSVPAAAPLAFNALGSAWAMAYQDGSVWIYDVATARPIGLVGPIRDGVTGLAFDSEGRTLRGADKRGNVFSWPVPQPSSGTAEAVVRHVQSLTGMKIDSGGAVAFLSPSEWGHLRSEAGDPLWNDFSILHETRRSEDSAPIGSRFFSATERGLSPGGVDELDWHEANARDSEALGDGFGACWHLDRLISRQPDQGLLYARRARVKLWAGDIEAARTDLERAINCGPRDRILDWLNHRALDSLSDKHPADTLQLLEPVIAARPDDWLSYALRADAFEALHRPAEREADLERAISRTTEIPFLIRVADERARSGRWREAATLYDRAIATGTVPHEVWLHAATAHLQVGDNQGYQHLCQALRARNATSTPEPFVASIFASALVLGPDGLGDGGNIPKWIETLPSTIGPSQKPLKRKFLHLVAAALFRAGRFQESILRINEAIALGHGERQPEETLYLALSLSRIGQPDKAIAVLAGPLSDEPFGPSSEDWWDALSRRLIRIEALSVILDPFFPTDPFRH